MKETKSITTGSKRLCLPIFIVIEAEVLLDNLLAGGDRDLDGPLDHGTDPLVHRLLDRQLDQLDDLRVLLEIR